MPFVDMVGSSNGDAFGVLDFGFEDCNSPDENLGSRNTISPSSPSIARELRASIPLVSPLTAERGGGFVIIDGNSPGVGCDHVGPAGVDDGFACYGVEKAFIVDGESKRKLHHRFSVARAVGLRGVTFEGEGFPIVGEGFD